MRRACWREVPCYRESTLAHLLLRTDWIPWLPTDVIRTVLRRVLPELDAVDNLAMSHPATVPANAVACDQRTPGGRVSPPAACKGR